MAIYETGLQSKMYIEDFSNDHFIGQQLVLEYSPPRNSYVLESREGFGERVTSREREQVTRHESRGELE